MRNNRRTRNTKIFAEVYRDESGDWRWRARHIKNHRVMADSGEGYRKKRSCLHGVDVVLGSVEIREVDQ